MEFELLSFYHTFVILTLLRRFSIYTDTTLPHLGSIQSQSTFLVASNSIDHEVCAMEIEEPEEDCLQRFN